MANIQEILARANSLRHATAINSINPERAGGIMYDTLIALNELWLSQGAALVISKIYASVAAMQADTSPVSDLSGRPLLPGQIVVIASSDSDNGKVYRYNGTQDPSWSSVGYIGGVADTGDLEKQVIYDVTLNNSNHPTFASLSALLSDANLSTLIPTAIRCGGMNIRFMQSSDNKYAQYRLKANSFSTTESDWENVGGDVVDNLNSNETDKALSAKQGSILRDFVQSLSLIDKKIEWQVGFWKSNGEKDNNNSWRCTEVPILGKYILLNTAVGTPSLCFNLFLDANDNIISTNVKNNANVEVLSVPTNAVKLKISNYPPTQASPLVVGVNGSLDYVTEDVIQELENALNRNSDLLYSLAQSFGVDKESWMDWSYFSSNGARNSLATNYAHYETCSLVLLGKYLATNAVCLSSDNFPNCCWVDSNNVVISTFRIPIPSNGNVTVLEAPANAVKVYISNKASVVEKPFFIGGISTDCDDLYKRVRDIKSTLDNLIYTKDDLLLHTFGQQDSIVEFDDFLKEDYGIRNIGNLLTSKDGVVGYGSISNVTDYDELLHNVNAKYALSKPIFVPYDMKFAVIRVHPVYTVDLGAVGFYAYFFDKDGNSISRQSLITNGLNTFDTSISHYTALANTSFMVLAFFTSGNNIQQIADHVLSKSFVGVTEKYQEKGKFITYHTPISRGLRYCAMGDSTHSDGNTSAITEGESNAAIFARLAGVNLYKNFARPGARVDNSLKTWSLLVPDDTRIVTVLMGINDIANDFSGTRVVGDIDVIMNKSYEELTDNSSASWLEYYRYQVETLKRRLDADHDGTQMIIISPLYDYLDYNPSSQPTRTQNLNLVRAGLKKMCQVLGINNGWTYIAGDKLGIDATNIDIYYYLPPYPTWIPNHLYKVDDWVIKDGLKYPCTTENSDAEWTPSHWGTGSTAQDYTHPNNEGAIFIGHKIFEHYRPQKVMY